MLNSFTKGQIMASDMQGCKIKAIGEGVEVGRLNLHFGAPFGAFHPVRILK